ncbi:hypothetical protein DV515_00013929 [Chloebia gouldiae]|uniref:Aromatic amino acid beta-eliminating lyase/threonine aldolase domain-containing protein n=1 Tax=Chloebia gouldiae TaxID=44316 RepID=A0A3L8RZD6_CHLGU|nr:hypothetical protein DV515_00013929 [Chloebia gouldiae]
MTAECSSGQCVEPAQIAQHCDSVSLCFSKVCLCGEGSPGLAGASTSWSLALVCRTWAPQLVLAGCREFVTKAWGVWKLLGRGMGQVGVLAAAATHLRLQQVEAMMHRDHNNTWSFAEGTSGPLSVLRCDNTPGTAQQCCCTGGLHTIPGWPHWVSSQVRMLLGSSPGWSARIMP